MMRYANIPIVSAMLLAAAAGCSQFHFSGTGLSGIPAASPSVAAPSVAASSPATKTDTPRELSPAELAKIDPSKIVKAEDKPKRQPQAMTCVKYGQCLEHVGDKAEDKPELRRQRYDQARRAYEQAIGIDPKCQQGLQSLARLHDKQGSYEAAVAAYKQGIKQYPDNAGFWFDLGMCWGRQKNWDQAIECLRKASELDPTNTNYSNYIGWALARAGREKECLAHFCKTVGEARAHYHLALMMHHLNNDQKSRLYVQASLKLDPKLQEAEVLLASLNTPVPVSAEPVKAVAQSQESGIRSQESEIRKVVEKPVSQEKPATLPAAPVVVPAPAETKVNRAPWEGTPSNPDSLPPITTTRLGAAPWEEPTPPPVKKQAQANPTEIIPVMPDEVVETAAAVASTGEDEYRPMKSHLPPRRGR